MRFLKFLIISAAVFQIGLSSAYSQVLCVQDGTVKDGKCEKVYSFTLNANLSPYHYKVIWDQDDKIRLDRIEIFKEGQDSPFQTISTKTSVTKLDFLSTDANFDKYNDILILARSEGENFGYALWVYDKEKEIFVNIEGFENVANPSFKKEEKNITSTFYGDHGGLEQRTDTYSINKTEIKLKQRIDQKVIDKKGHVYISDNKKTEGELKQVSEEIAFINSAGEKTTVCGPEKEIGKCAPINVIIEILKAERELDADKMLTYYSETILYNGFSESRQAIGKLHRDYINRLSKNDMSFKNFKLSFYGKDMALVECDVHADYILKPHPENQFSIRKRYRLVQIEDEWKIECEEVAKRLDGKSDEIQNKCVLPK
jgi:hypothetical protein